MEKKSELLEVDRYKLVFLIEKVERCALTSELLQMKLMNARRDCDMANAEMESLRAQLVEMYDLRDGDDIDVATGKILRNS